jgi:hypothetical protein
MGRVLVADDARLHGVDMLGISPAWMCLADIEGDEVDSITELGVQASKTRSHGRRHGAGD